MQLLTLFSSLVPYISFASSLSVTKSDTSYIVDTGSSNEFITTIDRSSCDITSLKYGGIEYQYQSTNSHIASGLGTATVTYEQQGDYAVIKCVVSDDDFDLTHHMIFAPGEDNIYMGTYTRSEPSIGELRFIFRLNSLDTIYPSSSYGQVSDVAGGTAIEASDVYLVGSQTRSKFYSSQRFIDDRVYCATNSAASIHACFARPTNGATEKSSGGPFFRDINLNKVSEYQSLTYYMNSGHPQTESYRQGFHGPYIFSFAKSDVPLYTKFSISFFDDLSLAGYTKSSQRGVIAGAASGTKSQYPTVLHWYNSNYQGWTTASSSGSFLSPALVAGTYTMALYQDEFLAATQPVTVRATATVTSNIAATNTILTSSHTTIWKMGDYDGQPTGFLNADKQVRMHPSDARMSKWSPGTVASTAPASWPMAMWKDVNSGQKISFTLGAKVAATATLRIATTLSEAGGRPQPTVNGYVCSAPAAPTTIDSRGITRGAYRGYGDVYDCKVPSGTLTAGSNTVEINVISGAGGDDYLSPSIIFDAIELFY